MARAVGAEEWRVAAFNRQQWAGYAQTWLQQEAIPWSASRQSAICN